MKEKACGQAIAADGILLWTPFFAGINGPLAAGHEPSEQVPEGFFAALKSTSCTVKHHRNTDEFLAATNATMKVWCTTRGHRHSLLGTTLRCYPLPLDDPSRDFLEGPGRRVKILGRVKALATVPMLEQADERQGNVIFRVTETMWVVKAFQPLTPVVPAEAQFMLQMLQARSEGDLLEVWRQSGVVVQDEGAAQARISLLRSEHFFNDHCVVLCSNLATGRLRGSCRVYAAESLCPHCLAVLHKEVPGRLRLLAPRLPLGTGGRSGRPRRSQALGAALTSQAQAVAQEEAARGELGRRRQREDAAAELEGPAQRIVRARAPITAASSGARAPSSVARDAVAEDQAPIMAAVSGVRAPSSVAPVGRTPAALALESPAASLERARS